MIFRIIIDIYIFFFFSTRYAGEHVNETLKCTTHANGDIQEMLPFAMKLKKNVKGEHNFRVFTWFLNLKFYVD